MQLSALSGDSLLCIFAEIDLLDLLCTVPLVCSTWSILQPMACKQRRKLTLVLAPSQQQFRRHRRPQQLCPSRLDRTSAQWLVDCLPRINRLAIYHHYATSESFDEQVYLLHHWSPTLTSLTLHSSLGTTRLTPDVQATAIEALGRLLAAVNALSSLRFLALHSRLDFPRMDLPIFGQLQKIDTLNVRSPHSCKVLVESLLKFALANPNLDELCIFFGSNHIVNCMLLLSNDQLVSKIRHLHFDHDHTSQLAYLVQRCTNLQQVHLCLPLQALCERLHLLAQLPQLLELRLTIVDAILDGFQIPAFHYQSRLLMQYRNDVYSRRSKTKYRRLNNRIHHEPPTVQLPTVRRFRLAFQITLMRHDQIVEMLSLNWLFPNVHQVDFALGVKGCSDCRFQNIDAYNCTVQMIRTMGRIKGLKYVQRQVEGEDDPWIGTVHATLKRRRF